MSSGRVRWGRFGCILLALWVGERILRPSREEPRIETPPWVRIDVRPDWRRSGVRELRRLPGIGRRRALAIVTARWEDPGGGPGRLSDVPGIGEITEAKVRAWERTRGIAARGVGP